MRLLLIRHGQTPANVRGELDTAAPGPGLTDPTADDITGETLDDAIE